MIAFFDSGFGGLTVYKEVERLMPEYDYIYFGDGARAPYGNRGPETVQRYTEEAICHLFGQGARLIILACNTASALALRYLQQKYCRPGAESRMGKSIPGLEKSQVKKISPGTVPGFSTTAREFVNPHTSRSSADRKILGVIFPVVEKAAELTRTGHIGLVGTRGTVDSKTYERELAKLAPSARIFSQACPLIVPFIEEGWHEKPEARMILKKYLKPLKSKNIDTLILGCTHYPFMIRDFKRVMGKRTQVLHTGEIVAHSLKDYLKRHPGIEAGLGKNEKREFFTTNSTERFERFAKKFLKLNVKTEKIEIDNHPEFR